MELGMRIHYVDKYGLDEGLRRMAKDGYDAIDYSFSNTETALYAARDESFFEMVCSIKKSLDAAGVRAHQIHGPWRYPARDATDEDRAERFEKMTKAMVIAKYLGARYMAVHPLMPYGANSPENPEDVYRINRTFYSALANVAGKLGVILCLENMPFSNHPIHSTEDVCRLVEDIRHPNLKVCFDTGHANATGENIAESVRRIGKDLLMILHVHDNDGTEDSHMVPYDGNIDWGSFCEALYDIGFEGVMSLEVKLRDGADEEDERQLAKIGKLLAGVN